MKAEKIREWSLDELKVKDKEFAEQLFRLKFQFASGQADILEKMRVLRRDIARVKTLLREEELKAEAGGKS